MTKAKLAKIIKELKKLRAQARRCQEHMVSAAYSNAIDLLEGNSK